MKCNARQWRATGHCHALPGNDGDDGSAWSLWGNGGQWRAMAGNGEQCGARQTSPTMLGMDRRGTPRGCPHCRALLGNDGDDSVAWSLWGNGGQCAAMRGNARAMGRIRNGVRRTTMYVLIYNEAGSVIP